MHLAPPYWYGGPDGLNTWRDEEISGNPRRPAAATEFPRRERPQAVCCQRKRKRLLRSAGALVVQMPLRDEPHRSPGVDALRRGLPPSAPSMGAESASASQSPASL